MEPTQPQAEGHHHRSARERQRRGPMWTFMRRMTIITIVALGLLTLVIGGGWWYLGTTSFADLVRLRVQKTLESRLGRAVTIHDVDIVAGYPSKVILNDLRIANAPGALNPYFATVKQVVISGGVESFWGRTIAVSRIDVIQPHLFFEIYPAGSKLGHNFPHWESGPRSKYDIYHLDLGTMYVTGGGFDFLDRRHDFAGTATDLATQIDIASVSGMYQGTVTSPLVHLRLQNYAPFDLDLRGQYRYTPNSLELRSIAMRGAGMALDLNGHVAPLADAVYNLRVSGQVELPRAKQIFRIQQTLEGLVAFDGRLRGRQGTFTLDGAWRSPKVRANAYDLTEATGQMNVTDSRTVVDVQHAGYGGGTISARYSLPQYSEPYPQNIDLRYHDISLEKLFSDWTVEDTGLRGAVTGRLLYRWNKDRLLAGKGDGTATLSANAVAFSNAKYPIRITGGSTGYALDGGVVTFRDGAMLTDASRINFSGTLRIQDVSTNLLYQIHSSDFAELDRAGLNFAHSAGKTKYSLLGLGGAGDITGTITGPLKTPQVVARIAATGTKYNEVELNDSDIDLRYDGVKGVLTFEHANFHIASASRLGLTGTVTFPDSGPSPQFDLAVDALNYPVDRAIATVELKLAIAGTGTGKLLITGTPDAGRARFVNLLIRQTTAELGLNGDVDWAPGKGNIAFGLDIAARSFPVADIAKFLDLGTVPITGDITGTLHLEGPKAKLGGAGSITVRNGTVSGEPVTVASAGVAFTEGTLKVTKLSASGPAGTISGEAQLNMTTNEINYSIKSSSIDLAKVHALSSLAGVLGGTLVVSSHGSGTLDHPEAVLEATLNQATLKGFNLPAQPPPSLNIEIRNGRLTVRGSALGVLTIEGDSAVGGDGSLDGLLHIKVTDVAKLAALSPNTATVPIAGSFTADLRLGGKLSSLEAVRIDGSVPQLDLRVSEHEFTAPQPLTFALRDGRVVFGQFTLQRGDTGFNVSGYVEIAGAQQLDVHLKGELEAVLLQPFVPGLRAEGHMNVSGGVTGTLSDPRLSGSAEIQDTSLRFAGFPQVLDHINGTLVFKSDRIEIDSLRIAVGGGTVIAGGYIGVEGLVPKGVRLNLQGTDVSLRYFEGLTVESDFNIVVSGGFDRAVVTGDVNVKRGLYFKDVDFGQAVLNVVLARRSVAPIVAASWQEHVALRLHVAAPGTLAVRNNIADLTGSADLDVNGTLANPVVIGLVTLDEGGKVRFQSIDYRLVRGSINFQNPFRLDPYFDVTLEARVNGGLSEIESGPLNITVALTGTLDRISPVITSDPPASDITLFSLLGLGGMTGPNGGPSNASLAGKSLLYQSLSRAIGSKVLPFADTFSYDPGTLDTSGDPGPKVTFEKHISNNVDVFVVYAINEQKSKEVVEWEVSPEWVLQVTRDLLLNQYRIEGRFRRGYEAHWNLGRHGIPELFKIPSVTSAVPLKPVVVSTLPAATAPAPVTASAPPSTLAQLDEQPIATVEMRSDASFNLEPLRQYIKFKAGGRLTIRNAQETIKALFATGDFRDVRVNAKPGAEGVLVTVVLSLNYRIAEVHFVGLGGRERGKVERGVTFHPGDVFSLSAVDRSAVAVQQQLARDGFLESAVDPETSFDRATSVAIVTLHVSPGVSAHVGQVVVEGETAPYTSQDLINRMHRGPGKLYRIDDARSDANRMQRFLLQNDFRKAEVRFLGPTYDQAAKLVTLRYSIAVGPKVRVAVNGPTPRFVRRLLPFTRYQSYSEDVVEKAGEDIATAYQQRGFFNVTVDTVSALEATVWTTTYKIAPGQEFSLTNVTFTGSAKEPAKALANVVVTSRHNAFLSFIGSMFGRGSGVTREQLSSDRDALESFYRLNGFSEAKVATPVVSTNGDAMTVDFPITEGPQTLVTAVTIEGNEQVTAKKLPAMKLRAGKPLNPQLERADTVALQTYYGDRGNAEVQVKANEDVTPDKTAAKVAYVVSEGPKINIGDVIVRGNSYTNTSVIRRKAQVDKGDPFSYSDLLEAQRNLYGLGIFQRVDIQPEPAGTSLDTRNVAIAVEEGKDLTVSGSVGVASAVEGTKRVSPLVSASIAHRDLFGTGRYLGLELIGAQNNQNEVFLTYREPFIGRFNVPVQFTIFQNSQLLRNVPLRERGGAIEASRVARNHTRFSLRYEYRLSDCTVEQTGDLCDLAQKALIPGLDRTFTNVSVSSITPAFLWDKRDDAIDPHRGFFTTASVEYAFKFIHADAQLLKETLQGSWYMPVFEHSVFTVAARVGLIQALGGVTTDPVTGINVRSGVPLSEKFTAGGDSSQRAYPLDLLGTICLDPRNAQCVANATLIQIPGANNSFTVAPIGGNALLVMNAEYRFPIGGPIGGTFFVDAGNTFAKTSISFGELRYGVGGGLRYLSPVGPVRFDVGYKLHRQIIGFESEGGRAIYERPFAYFLTLGYAF